MGKHRENSHRPEPDYDVGYRVPPEKGKFKPGQSGNPKGRPRRLRTIDEDRDIVLHELITVDQNGRPAKITVQSAILRAMAAAAVNKRDVRAARFLFDLNACGRTEEPSAENDKGLSTEDRALLADFARRTDIFGDGAANDDDPPDGKPKPEEPSDG